MPSGSGSSHGTAARRRPASCLPSPSSPRRSARSPRKGPTSSIRVASARRSRGGSSATGSSRPRTSPRTPASGESRSRRPIAASASSRLHRRRRGSALLALNLLEGFPLATLTVHSVEHLHLLLEMVKLAYADRDRWIGDPAHARLPVEALLTKAYAADRKSTRLNSSHLVISYAVFCLKKKKNLYFEDELKEIAATKNNRLYKAA